MLQETVLLQRDVEQLYVFKTFLSIMKNQEAQIQSSPFTARLQDIENGVNSLINQINGLVSNIKLKTVEKNNFLF